MGRRRRQRGEMSRVEIASCDENFEKRGEED
jgi:hypothetical protein